MNQTSVQFQTLFYLVRYCHKSLAQLYKISQLINILQKNNHQHHCLLLNTIAINIQFTGRIIQSPIYQLPNSFKINVNNLVHPNYIAQLINQILFDRQPQTVCAQLIHSHSPANSYTIFRLPLTIILLLMILFYCDQIKKLIQLMTNNNTHNLPKQLSNTSEIFQIKQTNTNIQAQAQSLTRIFKAYTEQNQKLTHLYQTTKLRNKELSRMNCKFLKDIDFLKQYCFSLNEQLTKLGYYKLDKHNKLLRKETADSIFKSYTQQNLNPALELGQKSFEVQLLHLRNRNLHLQKDNKQLNKRLANYKQEIVSKANQILDLQTLKKNCELIEEKAKKLEKEVRDLRTINQHIQFEKAKKAATNYILKDQAEIFKNVHNIIKQYKNKLSELSHEKKDIQKKYKLLKQKINQFDLNKQYRLIDLYSEKMDMLQKLTEKQQFQIQNTINLYEIELKKIEDRRKQEIDMIENVKLNLQSENLKLCIDLQKSLNKNDNITLLLLQEKNKNQLLQQSLQKYQNAQSSTQKISQNCKIISKVLQYNKQSEPPFRSRMLFDNNISSRIIYPRKENEQNNSNLSNYHYDYSQLLQKQTIVQKLQESKSIRAEQSIPKNIIRDKITISYRQPDNYASYTINSNIQRNKTMLSDNPKVAYNSIIKYRKRFLDRKPESSFNQ